MRWVIAGVLLFVPAASQAQSTQADDLGAGRLLVASRELPDPNFSQSVVLLVQYDDDGVVGLIINRRSKVPLSHLADDVAGAKNRTDAIYEGGPVGKTGVLALLRSRNKPDDSKHVAGDIYLLSSKDALEKTLASATESALHVYVGYAGWTVPQLENEVELGAWYIFRGDPGTVFDSDPDSLWSRLIRQTELQIARSRPASPIQQILLTHP